MVFDERLGTKDVVREEVHIEASLPNEGSFSKNHVEVEQARVL